MKISITDNFNTVVTYFKGNDTFNSLTGRAEVRQTALSNQMWEISVADTEYVYLQLTSRQEGAFVKFTVQGQGDQVVIPDPVNPGSGSNPIINPGSGSVPVDTPKLPTDNG